MYQLSPSTRYTMSAGQSIQNDSLGVWFGSEMLDEIAQPKQFCMKRDQSFSGPCKDKSW